MKTRRGFLRAMTLAGGGTAAMASGGGPGAGRVRPRALPGDVPRHVIHLVADGMGSGIVACANHFSQLTRHRELTWLGLVRRPETVHALMDVRSQDSLVTDSSASASAWGCGARIPNGKVNQTSTGGRLVTLYELLGAAGWKRGLVTTTEITHATPAGFAACVKSRNDGEDIAQQYLERGVEVLMGGGRKHFDPKARKDKRDLRQEFARRGHAVLLTPSDLASAPGDRPLLGLFSDGHIPYVVDQEGGLTKVDPVPSLAAMTRAALGRLAGAERFVLQVEGGRVDMGCHNDDAAAAIREMVAFDEAIDVCLGFQREHPGTLLVITTDHATGNPGLNGMGDNYQKSNAHFRNLLSIRQSVPEIAKRLLMAESPKDHERRLFESTGYVMSARRREMLDPYLKKKGYALFDGMASDVAALGQVLANHTGVGFTSTAHTSDHVPLLALGPGSDAFRGFVANTEVFERYVGFAGVEFRNRQEPLVAGYVPDPGSLEQVREYGVA